MYILAHMAWADTYATLATFAQDVPGFRMFRGQPNAAWPLLPSLSRHSDAANEQLSAVERFFYFQYVTRAGDLLAGARDSWEIAFAMQHHGLPTRFLDWSAVVGVALHFAIANADSDAAIWVLNAIALNQMSTGIGSIGHARELGYQYEDYFIQRSVPPPGKVVALWPLHQDSRVLRQRGGFTMHDDLLTPLEALYPTAVTKITIPRAEQEEARRFLRVAGISEFSLFPDLDGLARELKQELRFERHPSSAGAADAHETSELT